jgi:hypothetical protein
VHNQRHRQSGKKILPPVPLVWWLSNLPPVSTTLMAINGNNIKLLTPYGVTVLFFYVLLTFRVIEDIISTLMSVRIYHHDIWHIREGILMFAVQVSEIGTVAGISRVLYDLTSKPPGILCLLSNCKDQDI